MVCSTCESMKKKVAARKRTKTNVAIFGGKNFWGNNMSYKWAEPTWHFFHCLAGKIHEDFYRANAQQIFALIRNINSVLPCPDCQNHAAAFFRNIRYTNYPSKESFRRLLLSFHNDVNRRTNKPILPRSYLNKYDCGHFINITNNFIRAMQSYKSTLGGGFVDTRQRQAMIRNIRTFRDTKYMYFS